MFLRLACTPSDSNEGLFCKSKINSHGIYVVKTKTCSEGFSKSKKSRCTTVNSHVNSSESNDLNTYNRDNFIGNANIPRINVHTELSSNELVTFQNETDTDSSTSINEKNMDDNTASEEIASHQNSTGVNDHTCDENGINLLDK